MTQQLLCSSSLLGSELGVDHEQRKRGESAHCAPEPSSATLCRAASPPKERKCAH